MYSEIQELTAAINALTEELKLHRRPFSNPPSNPPEEKATATMLRAIELRQQGLSYSKIAKTLNSEGLRNSKGGLWNGPSIQGRLDRRS